VHVELHGCRVGVDLDDPRRSTMRRRRTSPVSLPSPRRGLFARRPATRSGQRAPQSRAGQDVWPDCP
jgi:hypothetical protein